mgnify:FL=1
MKHVILVRYGEISLKGLNRNYFIDLLARNIRSALSRLESVKIRKVHGRIIVDIDDSDMQEGLERIVRVFGIVSVSPAAVIESRLEVIEQTVEDLVKPLDFRTFRVSARRADKTFPMQSMELARHLGGTVLRAVPDITVDLHDPELNVQVEVREETYVYHETIQGPGGLPVGCSGKTGLLLSGGIDSPVAGYMMAKRGLAPVGIYFHAFPYTSDRAKEKVVSLAKILAGYTGSFKLYVVPFTELQLEIIEKCPERQITILIRRYMARIAEAIAEKEGLGSLTTGESLGQVASQTQESLLVTNEAAHLPVLRPLIGMDKQEIVEIAQRIGTFETSILPYEDCCTIFVPKHPDTKPKLAAVKKSEEALAETAPEMIRKAVEDSEIIRV